MTIETLLPPCMIIVLGSMLHRLKFYPEGFIEKAIEFIYRIFFPVIVLWGVLNSETSLTLELWCLLFFAVLVSFMAVFLIATIIVKEPPSLKSDFKRIVQIIMVLGLSFEASFLGSEYFFYLSMVTIFVVSVITILFELDSVFTKQVEFSAKVPWIKILLKICTNPIFLILGFSLLCATADTSVTLIVLKSTDIIKPAVLPFCCLVFGAKLYQLLKVNLLRETQ